MEKTKKQPEIVKLINELVKIQVQTELAKFKKEIISEIVNFNPNKNLKNISHIQKKQTPINKIYSKDQNINSLLAETAQSMNPEDLEDDEWPTVDFSKNVNINGDIRSNIKSKFLEMMENEQETYVPESVNNVESVQIPQQNNPIVGKKLTQAPPRAEEIIQDVPVPDILKKVLSIDYSKWAKKIGSK